MNQERESPSDEFLSAIQRLPNPVFSWDGVGPLRPVNARGQRLLHEERLETAINDVSPHPLGEFLRQRLAAPEPAEGGSTTVEFPSGRRFEVEVSHRSPKGAGRLLIVILRDLSVVRSRREEELFAQWQLTEREREVARALLQGKSSDEICAALCISQNTLKSHLAHLFAKSGTSTRAELLAKTRD